MKLSTEQIHNIKNKISKKGFKYLDVQAEILDHIASSIEAKMIDDPALSLDEAYDLTYSDLGIFAFSDFEDSVKKKLRIELYYSFLKSLKILFTSLWIVFPLFLFVFILALKNLLPINFEELCAIITVGSIAILGFAWLVFYRKNNFLKDYLSFRISLGVHFSMFYIMVNLHLVFDNIKSLSFLIFTYLVIQLALFLGAQSIIKKTIEFNKLFYKI
jgi:hypothetical protein